MTVGRVLRNLAASLGMAFGIIVLTILLMAGRGGSFTAGGLLVVGVYGGIAATPVTFYILMDFDLHAEGQR